MRTLRPLVVAIFALLAVLASAAPTLGGQIHFPQGLDEDWRPAIAAVHRVREAFGAGAYVRFDDLWHVQHWESMKRGPGDRRARILAILKAEDLRPLMVVIPLPWATAEWRAPWQRIRDWGDPDPEVFPWIGYRYRQTIVEYRGQAVAIGYRESECLVQWGNEPAAGHPGGIGNDSVPRGTWTGHALWFELHREGVGFYGALKVLAPAASMLDEPAGAAELASMVPPADLDWTVPVLRRTMHFRYHDPGAPSAEVYADRYVAEMARRAAVLQALPWPKGSIAREASRRDGIWVTEGYVAPGDGPGDRAELWRAVIARVSRGVPGIAGYSAYRFYPEGGPDGRDWQIPVSTFSGE